MPRLQAVSNPVVLQRAKQNPIVWGDSSQWVLMAGPDSMESEAMLREVASELKTITTELGIPWILKCSFDKANRQSAGSFRGLGMKAVFRVFEKVKEDFSVPLLTDVHETTQVEAVSKVADIIQIPAFLCRQTDLVQESAKTNLPLNIKKGQFMAPWDMRTIVEKARAVGTGGVLLCERGTSFGYNRLINDFTGLHDMRDLGVPVVMDATHSVQLPGAGDGKSGGRRNRIELLARAAMAVGVDGLFLETHPDPDQALCDGPNSLHLKEMPRLLRELNEIWKLIQSWR